MSSQEFDRFSQPVRDSVQRFKFNLAKPSEENPIPIIGLDTFELLLMRDSERINNFLFDVLIRGIEKNPNIKDIRMKQLYVVPDGDINDWLFLFGEDISSPDISFPTYNQLREACDWYKKNGFKESFWTDNYDLWSDFQLTEALKKTEGHLRMISSSSFTSWPDLLLDGGEELQKAVLLINIQRITFLRKQISEFKKLRAPIFLIEEMSQELAHKRDVHSKLTNPLI